MSKSIVRSLRTALANPAWVFLAWFGMTAGVSLLATPIKFTAPLATRAIALDIGRVTFSALNKAELVALVLALIVVRVSGAARRWWPVMGILALILIAQSAWLLPELAARAEMVAGGVEPPPSHLHATYSILELSKLGILFVAGLAALGTHDQHTRTGDES